MDAHMEAGAEVFSYEQIWDGACQAPTLTMCHLQFPNA